MSVFIRSWGSVSSLGSAIEEIKETYRSNQPNLARIETSSESLQVYAISSDESLKTFSNISLEENADRVHKIALTASHAALACAGWYNGNDDTSVIIGSARGATNTIETALRDFIITDGEKVKPWTSPITTAGNIAAFISKEFNLGTPISTSMTCASALESILTACAFINSGFSKRCLAGGAEAPLTQFGLSQMQALRIYSKENDHFPCKPCAVNKLSKSALALGEGAAIFCLTSEASKENLAEIISISSLVESIDSPTGMDSSGEGFVASMKTSLKKADLPSVDAIILHAPGTTLGDSSELNAINQLYGDSKPLLFTTKHLTGHTFGASGALSLEIALLLLQGFRPSPLPYHSHLSNDKLDRKISTVMINCAGFGGVVGSIIIQAV